MLARYFLSSLTRIAALDSVPFEVYCPMCLRPLCCRGSQSRLWIGTRSNYWDSYQHQCGGTTGRKIDGN